MATLQRAVALAPDTGFEKYMCATILPLCSRGLEALHDTHRAAVFNQSIPALLDFRGVNTSGSVILGAFATYLCPLVYMRHWHAPARLFT